MPNNSADSGPDRSFPSAKPYLATPHGVLYSGDCIDFMQSLDDGIVDTVFADPPFNLDKDYGKDFDDSLEATDYLEWTRAWLTEAVRVLKPGGSLFVYNIPKWQIETGHMLGNDLGMLFRHWIALTMKNTYPRGKSLYPAHYGILYYTKGDPEVFHKIRVPVATCRHCKRELKDYGGHRNKLNPSGLNLTDFWEDTSPVRHRKFKKRAANELKPMIPERCILMSTSPGDLVLDPFGGGGSTFEVAELRHRRWLGTELGNCEPIAERLGEAGIACELQPDPTLTPMDWIGAVKTVADNIEYEVPSDEIGEAPLKNGPRGAVASNRRAVTRSNSNDAQQLPLLIEKDEAV